MRTGFGVVVKLCTYHRPIEGRGSITGHLSSTTGAIMNYEVWLILFGDNAQREARDEGCPDCMMDDAMQRAFLLFVEQQEHGAFAFDDLVRYGNLTFY